MCGMQLKDRKSSKDLMLGLNETIDQLAMASSVRLYGHVLTMGGWSCCEKGIKF